MPWYKVTLSDNDMLADQLNVLRDAFSRLHVEAGDPDDAAIFATDDEGPACILYFSPGARRIAMQLVLEFSGVETATPMRSGACLLVGNQLAWDAVPFAPELTGTQI
jgi:hypothetical protein